MRRLVRGLLVPYSVTLLLLVTGIPTRVAYPQSTQNLRDFDSEEIPGPGELLKALGRIGIKPNGLGSQEWVDDLVKQGKQILEGMSPEQQKGMRELAEKYMRDRGITPGTGQDDALTDLARQFQQQLQNDPNAKEQIETFQKQFEEIERSQSSYNSNASDRIQPGVDPDNPLPENLLPDQGRGSSNSRRNNRNREEGGNSERPSPGKNPNADSNNNSNDQPDPDRDTSKNTPLPPSNDASSSSPSTNEENGSLFRQPPVALTQTPEEQVGVRFDRMLLEAAQRGLESTDAETRSRIAGSVDSILDHLAKNVESVVRKHSAEGGRRNGRGMQRNRRSESPFSNLWNRDSGDTSAGGPFSVSGLLSLWPLLLGAIVMGVVWWWLRYTGIVNPSNQELDEQRPVRYRYSRTRSPEQLVKSVDRFLLARFGRGANWWNVRRAQAQLANQEVRRVSDSQLEELVCAYEQSRYTSTHEGLGPDQIELIGEILRELALDLTTEPRVAQVQVN